MTEATIQQQPPSPSTGDVWKLVIADMEARREFGIAKYGTPVQVENGRDHLTDALQEALDLVVYLRAAIERRRLETPTYAQMLASKDAEIKRLQGEADLYRRGYELIGACDISNYLALCEEAGKHG